MDWETNYGWTEHPIIHYTCSYWLSCFCGITISGLTRCIIWLEFWHFWQDMMAYGWLQSFFGWTLSCGCCISQEWMGWCVSQENQNGQSTIQIMVNTQLSALIVLYNIVVVSFISVIALFKSWFPCRLLWEVITLPPPIKCPHVIGGVGVWESYFGKSYFDFYS